MTHIAIELDDTLTRSVNEACMEEHITPDRLALDALKRRLAVLWLKRTQRVIEPSAQAAGYRSEEEFLSAIS
jgi:hypothetical protein